MIETIGPWSEFISKMPDLYFLAALDTLERTPEYLKAAAQTYRQHKESVQFEKDNEVEVNKKFIKVHRTYQVYVREDEFGRELRIIRDSREKDSRIIRTEQLIVRKTEKEAHVIYNYSLEDGSMATRKDDLATYSLAQDFIDSII